MRYLPSTSNAPQRWGAGQGRPPAEQLAKHADLLGLLEVHDRVARQEQAARTELQRLADDSRDAEAHAADAQLGAAAAREGKPIPPAAATAQLVADRDAAVRAYEAQERAFAEIGQDIGHYLNDHREQVTAAARARREKALQAIEKLGDQFATAIEDETQAGAVADWFATGQYFPRAETWATDVSPDLARFGLDRSNTPHYPARTYITGVIAAIFEEETP